VIVLETSKFAESATYEPGNLVQQLQ